jgi:hypothetical protein
VIGRGNPGFTGSLSLAHWLLFHLTATVCQLFVTSRSISISELIPAPTKAMLKDSVIELELAKDAESKAVNVEGKTE